MIHIIDYHRRSEPDRLTAILSRGVVASPEVEERVKTIIEAIRMRGDDALIEYARRFDGVDTTVEELRVGEAETEMAYNRIDHRLLETIRKALENIRRFHERQIPASWFVEAGDGALLGKRVVPIERVGIYVPGGNAPLISTVLMAGVPATVAGVQQIALSTPPQKEGVHPGILVASSEVGITEIYRIGGAQAIAALAFGTATVRKVDKIVGPGNPYVVAAKRLLFGTVGIESLPGPSEILLIADQSADPRYVAADLLSQAEHSPDSVVVCITTSGEIAQQTVKEIEKQIDDLPRRELAEQALTNCGIIIVVNDREEALDLSNRIAPEHLELMVDRPWEILDRVTNAGAVFFGLSSPVPVGDFYCGTNHILPTGGTARFSSSLGVRDFVKEISIIAYTEQRLRRAADDIVTFANAEGLQAHARAVEKRFYTQENS
jgi:histidinol dehydrogenase